MYQTIFFDLDGTLTESAPGITRSVAYALKKWGIEVEDLRTLAEQGVELLTCGTCLNFYGLTDKLAVGGVTNMYEIVEKQMKATLVVRP